MLSRFVKGTRLGLLLAYPVVIYLLLSFQAAWPGALLVFTMIAWKLHKQHNGLWWTVILLLGSLLSAQLFGIDALIKLSPVFIHSSLFTLFLQSLYNTPLIEHFARLEFGDDLPPAVALYCRKLTILWTSFFAANIAGCVWLAIWGDAATWVLYNGLIVYLLTGALLLGEYLWRRIAFPGMEIAPLGESIRSVVNNGHRIWEQDKHGSA